MINVDEEIPEHVREEIMSDLREELDDMDSPPPVRWDDSDGRTPRPQQEEMIDFINDCDARYIMMDAPTGIGKSPVIVSVAKSQGGVILTPQKVLQDQYTRDWPDIPVVKGASNYSCPEAHRKTNGAASDCATGGGACIYRRDFQCEYQSACHRVTKGSVGIANYAWLLSVLKHRDWVGTQRWLLMDEGHQLESALVNAAQIEITASECQSLAIPFAIPDSLEKSQDLLERFYAAASCRVADLKRKYAAEDKLTHAEVKQMRSLDHKVPLIHHILWDCFDTEGGDRTPNEWVLDTDNASEDTSRCLWRPLYARGIFERLIEPLGTRILLTSATLIDPAGMAEWLGWRDYETYRLPSPFPARQRRVIYRPCGTEPVSHKNFERQMPLLIEGMDAILGQAYNSTRKGIIHAHSFRITRLIEELSRHRHRMIFQRKGEDQASVLARHAAAPGPSILVSPSMTEGVDLPGDLARFAIFPKVPYPNLGDKWVSRRKAVDHNWYDTQVAQTFVQGSGRIVRNIDDVGVTYILDAGFKNFYDRATRFFPPWWRNNITWL